MHNLFETILALKHDTINKVDLTSTLPLIDRDFIKTYNEPAGQEHYKLLAYIGSLVNGQDILDVGTYRGYSAIAFSINKNNMITTYDINNQHNRSNGSNIEFRIGEATSFEKYKSTPVILLDTYHDGVYETEFINHLRLIRWNGVLIMDDIHEFKALERLFDSLPEEKQDITRIGHWSGTGLVNFKNQNL